MNFISHIVFLPFALVLIACSMVALFGIFYSLYEMVQARRFSRSAYDNGRIILSHHFTGPRTDAPTAIRLLGADSSLGFKAVDDDLILITKNITASQPWGLLIKADIAYLGPSALLTVRNLVGPSFVFWSLFAACAAICATFIADNWKAGLPVLICLFALTFGLRSLRRKIEAGAARELQSALVRALRNE